MSQKVLIIGGVAGGASTAARLRRNDESAKIIMFEKGPYISFANCGLPYYIGGTIEERDQLLLQTPEAMMARFQIDVRVHSEVVAINPAEKTIEIMDHSKQTRYTESYDKLVLSPGSTPIKPPIPGIDSPNVFSLWNIPDTDAIMDHIKRFAPKRAAVIGGGFIGIEMAENLVDRKMKVSLVEMADQVMAPIDFDMATQVHRHMRQKGVDLHLNNGVKAFHYSNGVTTVELNDGKRIEADIVIFSIGIRPQSQLAKDAGLKINERGGIVVDDKMVTSDPSIYALGDAVEVTEYITRDKTMIPLAGPANRQGRIVADNLCGRNESYRGTQGTSIAKVFDLTVANTGLNEKSLKRSGKERHKDYEIALIHSKSHAGYYPGAMMMAIKLIYDMSGKVLGSQIVGYDGVDKRIDVIATAIRFGGTIDHLKDLELAYAPPFSSAKDPVNMVAMTAENVLLGKTRFIYVDELEKEAPEAVQIIDVRDPMEREMGLIEGSVNIPLNQLRSKLDQVSKDKKVVVHCAIGLRGYIADRILRQAGFDNIYNLAGGYTTYSNYKCSDNEGMCMPDADVEVKDSGEVVTTTSNVQAFGEVHHLNACGLQCPGPIAQVYKKMEVMQKGDILKIKATDPGFASDIGTWCKRTGNTLVESGKEEKNFTATIMKGRPEDQASKIEKVAFDISDLPNDKTMVVFSGDLDKAIASLIIANGAASMGRKVTMFFTFWGLNILRKNHHVPVKKDLLGGMFGMMMPRGTKKLGLSRMNMGGMGAQMIRYIMKKKNVDSIETLLQSALDNGVKIIACNMSMDLMGIHEDELIEGVDFGGVATYLGAAEEADVNLFI